MPSPTFPNNWEYGDDGCCANTISECVPIFGNLLAQENYELIVQEDNINDIALG